MKLAWRTLGKTGLKVTSVSFGCMTTSDMSVLQHAADIGIVHFDTARSYQGGNNERMVGAALKSRRKQVIISSKSPGKTKKDALADLETSLRELGTDYLDIWYLHNRNDPAEVTDDLLEAQREAKQAGKIRFAGVSTHFNMDRMLPYLTKRGQTDVVLTTYNFRHALGLGSGQYQPGCGSLGYVIGDSECARRGYGRHHDEGAGRRYRAGAARRSALWCQPPLAG